MKFTNVKKWLSMLLVVCSMLSLVACGKSDKDPAGDDSEKGTKVAVVFSSSGLGDKSFNDALYDGMKKAESTMGIQWVYSEPKDDAVRPLARAEHQIVILRPVECRSQSTDGIQQRPPNHRQTVRCRFSFGGGEKF